MPQLQVWRILYTQLRNWQLRTRWRRGWALQSLQTTTAVITLRTTKWTSGDQFLENLESINQFLIPSLTLLFLVTEDLKVGVCCVFNAKHDSLSPISLISVPSEGNPQYISVRPMYTFNSDQSERNTYFR